MKRLENPPNPYASSYTQWLGPPPKVRTEVYIDESKSILSKNDSPDLAFRWSVNPYRGCQHACSYCYARTTHEYLGFGAGSDFETRIVVKPHAAAMLAAAFAKRSWKREAVMFSGVTDCYQPLEAVWRLTRQCLEVCRDFRNPLSIVTKSYLIVRDAELLAAMNRRSRVVVYISIPFARDDIARRIEANAPTPSRRFAALRTLHEAGVPVGVMVSPIIPGLNDRDIPQILARAADCGASSACYAALRLPGSVGDVFLSRLYRELPDAAQRIESRIRDMRGGALSDSSFGSRMTGRGPYWESVTQLFETTAKRLHLRATAGGSTRRHRDAPPARTNPAHVQLPLFHP